ncbi:hypothetical protein BDW69DRAFT_183993 [Aspergillus filifer]
MRQQLPLELLTQVARYLEAENVSLRQYALVCRAWQAAFEAFIYKSVTIHSDKISEFDSIISKFSGSLNYRRLHVILTFPMIYQITARGFWKMLARVKFMIRKIGYEQQITRPLRLESSKLSGREQTLEPGTERDEQLGEFAGLRNGDLTPRPYRASFLNDGNGLELPTLPSVYQLSFENRYNVFNPVHRIWAAAALRIAGCCPNLYSLLLDIEDYVRPDHVDYMRKRRKALGEGLSSLPASLRVFRVKNRYDDVWHGSLPGPDLIAGAQDIFSHNLRYLSMRLQELNISRMSVALDLFCPFNADKNSPNQPSGYWPSLEVLNISGMNFLPTGEWLLDPTEEDEKENEIPDWDNESEDDYESIRIVEESPYHRSQLRTDLAHQSFTSLGLAARNMPRLRSAAFYFTVRPELALLLRTEAVSGTRTLTWQGYYNATGGYMPDDGVARAWGFELGDLVGIGRSFPTYSVELKDWPPASD